MEMSKSARVPCALIHVVSCPVSGFVNKIQSFVQLHFQFEKRPAEHKLKINRLEERIFLLRQKSGINHALSDYANRSDMLFNLNLSNDFKVFSTTKDHAEHQIPISVIQSHCINAQKQLNIAKL